MQQENDSARAGDGIGTLVVIEEPYEEFFKGEVGRRNQLFVHIGLRLGQLTSEQVKIVEAARRNQKKVPLDVTAFKRDPHEPLFLPADVVTTHGISDGGSAVTEDNVDGYFDFGTFTGSLRFRLLNTIGRIRLYIKFRSGDFELDVQGCSTQPILVMSKRKDLKKSERIQPNPCLGGQVERQAIERNQEHGRETLEYVRLVIERNQEHCRETLEYVGRRKRQRDEEGKEEANERIRDLESQVRFLENFIEMIVEPASRPIDSNFCESCFWRDLVSLLS